MSENGPWTEKEDTDFLSFLSEKADSIYSPPSIVQLCIEFKQRSGTSRTVKSLFKRIMFIRAYVDYEFLRKLMDDKSYKNVKILLTYLVPTDDRPVKEHHPQTHLELDDQSHTFEYKNKEGNVQSSEIQVSRVPQYLSARKTNKKIMEFLAEKSKMSKLPVEDIVFIKKFESSTGIHFTAEKYRSVKSQIYTTSDYDMTTKIKMMFVSKTQINETILKELRQDGVVEVDEKNRIKIFKANDGSFELDRDGFGSKTAKLNEFLADSVQLMNFVAKKSKIANSPLCIGQLSRDFIKETRSSVNETALQSRIRSLRSRIPKLENFDTVTKVRMLFSLSATIDQEYLNELQTDAIVEVDEELRITKYTANDGSLELQGDHSQSAKCRTGWASSRKRTMIIDDSEEEEEEEAKEKSKELYTYDESLIDELETCKKASLRYQRTKNEKEKLLNFIAEKCKETNSPLSIIQLSKEFIEKTGSVKTVTSINGYIRSFFPIISKAEDFDTETKMRMLFSLSAPIDQDYLNELQKNATVEVDEKLRITKYLANDGSLKLHGDHSHSAKCRTGWASSRKRFIPLTKEEEERRDKKSEEKGASKEEETNGYITNSGRLSKKLYSTDDFLHDELGTCEKASLGHQRTKHENKKLLNFIAEKSRQANSTLCCRQLCRDFLENIGSSRTIEAIESRIRFYRLKIPKLAHFDIETKVRMLFSLGSPIDQDYLNELRKNATVEVDENQRITKYKAKDGSLKLKGRHWSIAIKRKVGLENESAKTCKVSKSKFSEDVIYDGPGEPIPAKLPVKREPNVYDELFWQEQKYNGSRNEIHHQFLEEPIPKQFPSGQEPIEYQEQIWQEEKYKPDKMELLPKTDPDQPEVKLEPMEYQEQNTIRQEEEYKPDPLELFNMGQNPNGNTTDEMKLENSQMLEHDELDYFVEK